MTLFTTKADLHRPFAMQRHIEVEAPEFPDKDGNPTRIRFRTKLSVDDVLTLQKIDLTKTVPGDDGTERRPDLGALSLALFSLLAVDKDGMPIGNPDDNEWFMESVDGMAILQVVLRSNLIDLVFAQLSSEEKKQSDPKVRA